MSDHVWPLVLMAIAVVAIVSVLAMRLRSRKGGPPHPGPVAVPPEEVEQEEGPVYACMKCGSPSVRSASVMEGGIPGGGQGLAWICSRCKHRGPALEFEDATAYRQFVKGLNEDAREGRP